MSQEDKKPRGGIYRFNPRYKPPFGWLGGKSKLRRYIIEMIPKHNTYVEVFGGAMWTLLGKSPSKVEVYNDYNSELVTFWKVIQNTDWLEEMLRRMQFMFKSREIYDHYLNMDIEEADHIDRAIRFYYLLKLGFGGQQENKMMISAGLMDKSVDREAIQHSFLEVYSRIHKVWIENLSFDDLIPRWDAKNGSTFFFCDPPYYNTKGYKDAGSFGEKEHRKLRSILDKVKGTWLLTVNDCPQIRKLYDAYNIREVSVMYVMCKDKKGEEADELMITNYSAIHTQLDMFGMVETAKKVHVAKEIYKIGLSPEEIARERLRIAAKRHAELDAKPGDRPCFGKFNKPDRKYIMGNTSDEETCRRCIDYFKCKRESLVY